MALRTNNQTKVINMKQKPYIITVDGPAGVGKSTVCTDVAHRLDILHLDTTFVAAVVHIYK